MGWLRVRKPARIVAISLGLGLSTAIAAELTITPSPAPDLVGPVTDSEYAAAGWRFFDPGFLVDHLPFKLTVGQTISYNDNVANLPNNTPILVNGFQRLPSKGDFYSDTTISGASRFPMGTQTFFFNGTYAPRQYFRDTALNAENYSLNGGLDFNLADRCSGRLIGGYQQQQQSLDQTVGGGVNDQATTSFNETASCTITGHVSLLFNSGVSRLENAGDTRLLTQAVPFNLNDYTQQYVSAGLQYALSGIDTFGFQATFTNRDFDNRANILGLANSTHQEDYQFTYSRVFSAKLDANASGGVTVFSSPGANTNTLVEPVYSFSINYRPTPKVSASFSEARSAGAPQTGISDAQVNDTQSVSLSYKYSPKVNLTAVYSHTKSSNPTLQTGSNLPLLFVNSSNDSASLVATYSATPLLTATAAYTYQQRSDTSRFGLDAVSNVFRVGLIYTR